MSEDFIHVLQLTEEAVYNMALLNKKSLFLHLMQHHWKLMVYLCQQEMKMEEWAKTIQE